MRHQDPSVHVSDGGRYYIRPYVDRIMPDGSIGKKRERIYLQATSKKTAVAEKLAIMAKINKSQYVLQAQMRFSELLDHYEKEYVDRGDNLAASTAAKYRAHLKNHIRPALAPLMMAEVTTRRIDALLAGMATRGLSWATRMDTRNLLSGIFTQAERWGLWRDKNPALSATVGRKRAMREKRRLTPEQIRALFLLLPDSVRLICLVALSCTLRISEVLGLQWKHIDFERGQILVRQRWYRGDVDEVKSRRSARDVPMGELAGVLRGRHPGPGCDDIFVFSVPTHTRNWKTPGASRDDRVIMRYFLRPAAKKLGLYYPGFGFHAFRRQAVTDIARESGVLQAMMMAGHSRVEMAELYGLPETERVTEGIRRAQGRVM